MYKEKLVMHPYGKGIEGVSDFWLMRNEEIRSGSRLEILKEFGIESNVLGEDILYIIPYSRYSNLRVDHLVVMNSRLETYRVCKDPHPYNMHKVSSGMRVYVVDNWGSYFRLLSARNTREFVIGEMGIVWDSNVEYDREWYRELDSRVREYILIGECKEARSVLERNGRSYSVGELPVKKRESVKSKLEYCAKGELVSELSKRGIETTYDTVRKVIKIYRVPEKVEGYSVGYFVEFFKQRGKGLSREESHREALKVC